MYIFIYVNIYRFLIDLDPIYRETERNVIGEGGVRLACATKLFEIFVCKPRNEGLILHVFFVIF
jgi:hypothetical protein